MSERLLVVEDEKNLGSTLTERLSAEGFNVTWAHSQDEALMGIQHSHYDLALLDVGLPDGSGFEVAKNLRQKSPSTAIIFLTAFGNPEDRVRGLELGAEDYIVKPFHLKELLLRVKNGLKRAYYFSNLQPTDRFSTVQLGEALISLSDFQIKKKDQTYSLTHKECELLKLLIDRRGKVVSREEILNQIWSDSEYPTTRTIDNFIVRLRRMIEKDPEQPEIIKSIRGVGYQMN